MFVQMKASLLCFVTIALFYMYNAVEAKCYAFSGPSGESKECRKMSGYNDYQWVRCASNLYVKEKSNRRYKCMFGLYCTFNCMVELFDKHHGDVYDSCRCTPGAPPPRTYAYLPPPSRHSPTASASKTMMNLLTCVVPLIASFNLISL